MKRIIIYLAKISGVEEKIRRDEQLKVGTDIHKSSHFFHNRPAIQRLMLLLSDKVMRGINVNELGMGFKYEYDRLGVMNGCDTQPAQDPPRCTTTPPHNPKFGR